MRFADFVSTHAIRPALVGQDQESVIHELIGALLTIGGWTATGEITVTDLKVAVILVPAVMIGHLLGRRLAPWAEGAILRWSILAISTLAAGGLILRATIG